jgi:3-dehydroquinate synthase
MPVEDVITVRLGNRTYDILVGYDWLARFGQALRDRKLTGEVMVFTSPRVGGLYFDRLRAGLASAGFQRIVRHDVPDGEENKNWEQFGRAIDALAESFPETGAVPLVLNLGGGVVSDLGGFAAAVYRRGVPYVQLPTTLLACVDSGVGGKTGVNHASAKNLIGAIYQPKLVLADVALSATLDPREIRSGIAEIIKYAVTFDNELFRTLEERMADLLALNKELLLLVVRQCYEMKARVVESDEEDRLGKRIVLNFGHTVGHALEMAAEFQLTHGEAISVGMLAATRISERLGLCERTLYGRLQKLIESAQLPTSARHLRLDPDKVLEIMQRDKKFVGGTSRFVLIRDISKWEPVRGVDMRIVRDVVAEMLA